MSSINEAYARIDYAYLKQLESRIDDLVKQINQINNATHILNGSRVKASDLQIYGIRRTIRGNETNIKIPYPSPFKDQPVVSITLQDKDAQARTAVITSSTEEELIFKIYNIPGIRDGKPRDALYSIYVLAIGQSA